MLKKKYKIKRKIFQRIFLKGKVFHSPHFILRIIKDAEDKNNPSKFSFVASAKVARNATDRNRLKRRGYAVIRKNFNSIQSNYLCAFFFKTGASGLSAPDAEKEIIFLLKKAGVLFV